MSKTYDPRTRATLARFAARLGLLDLSVLDAELLEKFSDSDLSAAATAAGWKTGESLNRKALLARVRRELARVRRPASQKKRAAPKTYLVREVEPRREAPVRREEATVPWGYGVDRVKAMAVDPERLFVYWEVTDDAIARGRQELGSGGRGAALVVRVYDTTGRIFDGTNAHHHFDQEIGRTDRQWFFHIGRPESEVCVEIGVRSLEGGFSRIARSGRVEFSRRNPLPLRTPRWLTVRAWDGRTQVEQSPSREAAGAPPADPSAPGRDEELGGGGIAPPTVGRTWPVGTFSFDPASFATGPLFVERFAEETRVLRWEGAGTWDSWEAGPFSHEVEAPAPLTEHFVGGMRIYRTGPKTHVVYGPWEVVIRGLAAHRRRSVLARWEIHRSWISEEGREVRGGVLVDGDLMAGSSGLLGRGASERSWRAGSELRLGGASEMLWMGASERRFGGASERLYQAASERLLRGASERRFRGASERLLRGASERLLRGASERLMRGASEQRLAGGGSEARLGGNDADGYPRVPREPDSGR
jgi:hypothetical protein